MNSIPHHSPRFVWLIALGTLATFGPAARASTAYGTISNSDTVNDTGTRCHGFEIEIEDLHSRDVTFDTDVNRSLVAHFEPVHTFTAPAPRTLRFEWPVSATGWVLQESATLGEPSWTDSTRPITTVGAQKRVTIPNPAGVRFFRLQHP